MASWWNPEFCQVQALLYPLVPTRFHVATHIRGISKPIPTGNFQVVFPSSPGVHSLWALALMPRAPLQWQVRPREESQGG